MTGTLLIICGVASFYFGIAEDSTYNKTIWFLFGTFCVLAAFLG